MLPLYEAFIPEGFEDPENPLGVSRVSLVRSPAIKRDFKIFGHNVPQESRLYFNEYGALVSKEKALFKTDDKMQIVAGAVMLADTPIYRFDERLMKEYNIMFPKETVLAVQKKFTENPKFATAFNLNHLNIPVSAKLQESYISGANGFTKILGFEDIPVGSWMMAIHIEDKQEYADYILDKYARGFSVEIDVPQRLVAGEEIGLSQYANLLAEFATKRTIKEAARNLANMIEFNDFVNGLKKYKDRDQKIVNELSRMSKPDGFDYYLTNKEKLSSLLKRYEQN